MKSGIVILWLLAVIAGMFVLALLSGCAAEPPKQIVRTETVQVPVEVRIPIPQEYVQDCVVTEPKPACGKWLCNGQVAVMVDDYRAALRKCNADKQALRALK